MQLNSSGYSFVSLYQAYPSYHGASDITYNLFNRWPNKNKVLIQISNSNIRKKKIINVKKKIGTIGLVINIFLIIFKLRKFFKNYKKNYLIIEGASWAGFTLILIILIKIYNKNIFIIYHAHNLEYEVRKLKNNFIISFTTFYLEKLIYKISIGTSVSVKDANFVKKYYNVNSILFENGVSVIKEDKLNNKKIKNKNFILFCGSYTYWPNKIAINTILRQKEKILEIYPNIKFVFTGEGLPQFNDKNILSLGIVEKSKLVWLIKNCLFFYAPMPKAPGTKIKILESLFYGAVTLCSKEATVGIKNLNKVNNLIITSNKNLVKNLIKISKNKSTISKGFKNYYNFENKIKKLYEKINKI